VIKAQQLGIDRLRIVKRRRDTKVVARGVHPAWGDVILKVLNPVHAPHRAYTQLHIDSLLSRRPSPLFPRLHVRPSSETIPAIQVMVSRPR
jgi:hypothetical protein